MKLSVIIPIYNVEKYLLQGLESVFEAVRRAGGGEIICVDDGSTDASPEIIDRFAQTVKDESVQLVVIHKENAGVGDARNVGLRLAQCEWVTFADPDDYVSPDYYKDMLSVAGKDESIEVVGGRWLKVDLSGNPLPDNFQQHLPKERIFRGDVLWAIRETPYFSYIFLVWDKCYRRKMLIDAQIEFVKGVHPGEDGGFAVEALAASKGFSVVVPRSCYYYRQHPEQVMQHITVARRLKIADVLEHLIGFSAGKSKKGYLTIVEQLLKWYLAAGTHYSGKDRAAYINGVVSDRRLKKLFLPYLSRTGRGVVAWGIGIAHVMPDICLRFLLKLLTK